MGLFDLFFRKNKGNQVGEHLVKIYFENDWTLLKKYASAMKKRLNVNCEDSLLEALILRCYGFHYYSKNKEVDKPSLMISLTKDSNGKLNSFQIKTLLDLCSEDLVKKSKYNHINNINDWVKEVKSTSNVVICENDKVFYDNLFESLLSTGIFFYPSKEQKTLYFFVKEGTTYMNQEKHDEYKTAGTMKTFPMIYLHAFLWLRNLHKKNKNLYNHFLSIMNNESDFDYEYKINFINSTFTNKSIEQMNSDHNAISQLFYRLKAYNTLITRLGLALGSFIDERINEKENFIMKVNNDFCTSTEITNLKHVDTYAMDSIFIRDMLSGKEL